MIHLVGAHAVLGVPAVASRVAEHCSHAGANAQLVTLESGPDAGLTSQTLSRRFAYDPFAAVRLRRLLLASRPEVVVAWDTASVCYAATAGRGFRGRPRLVGCIVETADQPALPAWAAQRFDAWAVGSEQIEQQVERIRSAGSAMSRVQPPAFADPEGQPSGTIADEARPELPSVAVLAPLVRSSRIDESIWCFELLRVLQPEATMLVCGDGPERARLERYARLVSESDSIRFEPASQWQSVLQQSGVVWSHAEQSHAPCQLLTAMQAGLPVVASDDAGTRAVVGHGRSGFLTRFGDRAGFARTTESLLLDPSLAAEVGRRAAEDSAQHTTASLAKAIEQLCGGFAERADAVTQPGVRARTRGRRSQAI